MQIPGLNKLPEHCREGLYRYIVYGMKPGNFLTAVISNNFVDAVSMADHVNLPRLKDYAIFLVADAPSGCWGSEAQVAYWISTGGLKGKNAAYEVI